MTLEEAILHLQEKISSNKWDCENCREEHMQLLEWLKELRERRNGLWNS